MIRLDRLAIALFDHFKFTAIQLRVDINEIDTTSLIFTISMISFLKVIAAGSPAGELVFTVDGREVGRVGLSFGENIAPEVSSALKVLKLTA